MSADRYTYRLGTTTYVNLTNRCTNDCTFCIRNSGDGVGGYDLRLDREPAGSDVMAELAEAKPDSVVFCGFGEPTLNLNTLLQVGAYVKGYGGTTRINTNGHANLVHGRDITPELAPVIDAVSISMNAPDPVSYAAITRSQFGENGFAAMLDFGRKCLAQGIDVVFSVVDVLDEDETERCRVLAEEIGADFRIRGYVY